MQNPEHLILHTRYRPRPHRRSILSLATNFGLAIGAVALWDTGNAIAPIPQPQRISQDASTLSSVSAMREKPSPDAQVDDIIAALPTIEDFQEFVSANATHAEPEDVPTFVNTFRQPPERFQQESWSGPCNTFAEFASYWAYVHGGSPYIVSLWPKGTLAKCKESWHQIAVCQTDDELLVFDNKSVTSWRGTVEAYVEKEYPEKSVAPFGGIIPWRLTRDNFRAKLASHMAPNAEELEISALPHRPAPPPQLIAKD